VRKRAIRLVIVVAIFFTAAFADFIWRAHLNHRSVPGHIVRFFRGESGAKQQLKDLAEDIRQKPDLKPLQSWAVETMDKFKEGKVHDTGDRSEFWYGGQPALKLPPQSRPDFIKREWGETNLDGEEEPEILVVMGTKREPESIAIAWYQYCIEIGRTNFQMAYDSDTNMCVEAKPGIYVFWSNYK